MLNKILVSGASGIDQGILELARKMGLETGGWVSSGFIKKIPHISEEGGFSIVDHENETERMYQNLIHADGVFMLFEKEPDPILEDIRESAGKHSISCKLMDISQSPVFQSAMEFEDWCTENRISTVFITMGREKPSGDFERVIFDFLETAFHILFIDPKVYHTNFPFPAGNFPQSPVIAIPQDVDQAVEMLLERLTFREKTIILNSSVKKLATIANSFEGYIKNEFRLWEGNERLLASCLSVAGEDINKDPVFVIMRELKKKLNNHPSVLKVL